MTRKKNFRYKWEFDKKTKKNKFYRTYETKDGFGVDYPENSLEEDYFEEQYYKTREF